MGNPNLEFRKIKSLDFMYEVNGTGTILRNVKSKKQIKIKLDFHHSEKGYYSAWISFKKKVRRISIAKVVAECWLGEKPSGYEIDHIDRDSHNNSYTNLRYVTRSEQMKNRDYTRIAAIGTKNLQRYVKSIEKPVTLKNEAGFPIAFESIAACARYLAEHCDRNFEHMRYKLKKKRAHIYGYDVIYRNAETVHARPTGQETVHL